MDDDISYTIRGSIFRVYTNLGPACGDLRGPDLRESAGKKPLENLHIV